MKKLGGLNFRSGESSIEILPLTDLHHGSFYCDGKLIKKAIKYIKDNPNCYTMLLGDITHNANLDKGFTESYKQLCPPQDQVKGIVSLLEPIKDKILFGISGNHGAWSARAGFNPDELIADMLDIPFTGDMAIFSIVIKGREWVCVAHHGCGGAGTDGARLNAAIKLRNQCINANLILMGHYHKITYNQMTNNIYDYGRLVQEDLHVVLCGSAYKYNDEENTNRGFFENFAIQKNLSPSDTGFVKLVLSGDRHTPGARKINFSIFK